MENTNSHKLLVIVDMQNDFIVGPLGTEEAFNIVDPIVKFIEDWNGSIKCTMDTHYDDYLETQEGKKLPVKHCIKGTHGWQINDDIAEACTAYNRALALESNRTVKVIQKNTFGSMDLARMVQQSKAFDNDTIVDAYNEVHFVGVCTGICVIANAILVKTVCPEMPIYIHKDLCACVSPESHERAIESMRTLQMNVV